VLELVLVRVTVEEDDADAPTLNAAVGVAVSVLDKL
jgi:hypothetical protein